MSRESLSEQDSTNSAKLLRIIGDLERISDHAVNILESVEEIRDKKIVFTEDARQDLFRLTGAVEEILELSISSFLKNDGSSALLVNPLEEVIDDLKEQLRSSNVFRLQKGECSFEAGFVWSDLLTDLERVADHCSNIANCMVENFKYSHKDAIVNAEFVSRYDAYAQKYGLN